MRDVHMLLAYRAEDYVAELSIIFFFFIYFTSDYIANISVYIKQSTVCYPLDHKYWLYEQWLLTKDAYDIPLNIIKKPAFYLAGL